MVRNQNISESRSLIFAHTSTLLDPYVELRDVRKILKAIGKKIIIMQQNFNQEQRWKLTIQNICLYTQKYKKKV